MEKTTASRAPTMTRSDLAKILRPYFGVKDEARRFVAAFFEELGESIAARGEVKIHGFGVFRCRDKKARMGRDLKSGKTARISARRVATFVAGDALKREVERAGDE